MPLLPVDLPPDLLSARFGFGEFRPGQRAVIDALLRGESALAVFPTGAGKSLCYQLPSLVLDGVTLVVSPLIALMKDQIDFLAKKGIEAARLDSSLTVDEQRVIALKLKERTLKLLYVAPERFNNERFLTLVSQISIALFAVDEAHCISEWGHNFRPDYLKLAGVARALRAQRVLALTATATPTVVKDICRGFGIAEERSVVTGFYRSNLKLLTTSTTPAARDGVLVERLRSRPLGPTLVYVTLQQTAEHVARMLSKLGFAARAYHAGMDAPERAAVQDWWQASDAAIAACTIAFGMGIDKANVRYVYHYNLPKSVESYMQEIGRAGRDDLPATLELLACVEDVGALESFAYGDTPSDGAIGELVTALLGEDERFDVSLFALSRQHDLRPLVVKTALTYLELLGAFEQGTPFYAGYEARPILEVDEIASKFDGERARFASGIFAHAKRGRTWYAIDPTQTALALGSERERVVRALEYFDQQGYLELRVSDARLRFRRIAKAEDAGRLTVALTSRFARREAQAIEQIEEVLRVVTSDVCQTNALIAHFGETRSAPCGHCSVCLFGHGERLAEAAVAPPIESCVDVAALRSLAIAHPRALGEPRKLARFLCRLSSPAVTAAKLSRHSLYGALEGRRFRDVLRWCESILERTH